MDKRQKERLYIGIKLIGQILKAIAIRTIKVSSLLAPNLAQALPLFGLNDNRRRKPYTPCDLSRALMRLKHRGAIQLVQTPGGYALRITKRGNALLARYQLGGLLNKKPRHWDRVWRVIVFDVREERKSIRDAIRRQLQSWSFFRLQDSVWVYPYRCEEAIELMKTAFRAQHDIYYLEVPIMAHDHRLRRHFGLAVD